MSSILAKLLCAAGMIVSDGSITILKKVQYESCAPGLSTCPGAKSGCDISFAPSNHQFNKPWIQTSVMFVGEACSFIYYFIKILKEKWKKRKYLLMKENKSSHSKREILKLVLMFALFGFLDLIGTTVASIGLLWVPGSAFQLLRGTVIIFTELGSILILKRKTNRYRWIGIGLVVTCMILVGVAGILDSLDEEQDKQQASSSSSFSLILQSFHSLFNPQSFQLDSSVPLAHHLESKNTEIGRNTFQSSFTSPESFPDNSTFLSHSLSAMDNGATSKKVLYILGASLILGSQVVGSLQMVLEEMLLKGKSVDPVIMVGFEGTFGFMFNTFIALPIVHNIPGNDCGKFENVVDGLWMMTQSWLILGLSLGSVVLEGTYNVLSLTTTKHLSAVHRTIVDALTMAFVWIIMILIKLFGGGKYGESFTRWSFIQIIGFVVMVFGTLIFNGAFPCLRSKQADPTLSNDAEASKPINET
ncbi:putative Solute carrier family 35 member F6 [Monocercomonoides exilis]|uniref:putative Solute carrier family 35 member F6 n=1 Tax=Monocercomonoides exilis TaxID=2049356 RepID=UPI003559CC77|nr:putative Solute carrier family 35 member F6 [Monocercomonoides exilis]|eukprot:MONOS_6984.1-p1 / transcript=MONOS_6984.1 / gene=MONOS_6984 / organism=Monocercomonoides_exilis_PA203 / gene_product=integral membrane protein, putative / transcript_product=integral membrane protein, putative / location=Mono_scaffold00230:6509-8751(+) / protein_length=472 / sequence_SO=supercontig / SO=protein_coding / is_pseudo=false